MIGPEAFSRFGLFTVIPFCCYTNVHFLCGIKVGSRGLEQWVRDFKIIGFPLAKIIGFLWNK